MVEGLFLKYNGEEHLVYRYNIPVPRWLVNVDESITDGFLAGKRLTVGSDKRYFFNDYFRTGRVGKYKQLSSIVDSISVINPFEKERLNYGAIVKSADRIARKPLVRLMPSAPKAIKVAQLR